MLKVKIIEGSKVHVESSVNVFLRDIAGSSYEFVSMQTAAAAPAYIKIVVTILYKTK
jgi:hypothetical protein